MKCIDKIQSLKNTSNNTQSLL